MAVKQLAEVGRVVFPKKHLDPAQLFLVPSWDGDFDVYVRAIFVSRLSVQSLGEQGADSGRGEEFKGEADARSAPFLASVFEDLEDGGAHVVFGVKPGEGGVRVEGRFPDEAAVWLEFHAEERVGAGGEVVVVDSGIDECRWEVDLSNVLMVEESWCG